MPASCLLYNENEKFKTFFLGNDIMKKLQAQWKG